MSGFGTPRNRAIEVLVAGGTIEDAAEAAGRAPRTIRRWLTDDEFAGELERARRQVIDRITNRLAGAALEAVEVLIEIIAAPASTSVRPAYVRLGAAKAALDLLPRYSVDGQILRRIERLEAELLTEEAR